MQFNPFVPSAPFLYPLKTSENLTVFWCFQEVKKGFFGSKWVNVPLKTLLLSSYTSALHLIIIQYINVEIWVGIVNTRILNFKWSTLLLALKHRRFLTKGNVKKKQFLVNFLPTAYFLMKNLCGFLIHTISYDLLDGRIP